MRPHLCDGLMLYIPSHYIFKCACCILSKSFFYLRRVADFSWFLLNLHLYEVFCLNIFFYKKSSNCLKQAECYKWSECFWKLDFFFPALEVKLSFCLSILFLSWIIVSSVGKVCDWLVQFLFLFNYFFVVADLEPGIFGSVFCITYRAKLENET